MHSINELKCLAQIYRVPIEDVLFVALNLYGVNYQCNFNRMRMGFSLAENKLFDYAKQRGIRDFYFALPINEQSPFLIVNEEVVFDKTIIGTAINPSEDFCDSNYSRRNGTVLNLNPNSRTACRGCKFCYTSYQIPRDRKKITCETEIKIFFDEWLKTNNLSDLSHLIQLAVVTGCYDDEERLSDFLLTLNKVLSEYKFAGEIFYLGSQISSKNTLNKLREITSFACCFSVECFERRSDLLRNSKQNITIKNACELMAFAIECGYRVNFSYVLGLDSIESIGKNFEIMKQYITSFPIINTIQIHKYHDKELLNPEAKKIEYFFDARKIIEKVFLNTKMRPRIWEDYRSLWFLKFSNESLDGIRTP